MSVSAADIAHWQSWVGRRETRHEIVDPASLRRFAAALGESLDIEYQLPSLAHWATFLPVAPTLGDDGHPARGGLMPPVALPRRMFAASRIDLHAPLLPGIDALRTTTIVSVTHKSGRSGDLVLVEVEHRTAQHGSDRVVECQTIVYRDAGGPTPSVTATGLAVGEVWQPGPVDLFRFSAATFNSHRIHYDLPYSRDVEGYPGLVVHGPFTAARLFALATRARPASRFEFRALAPLFANQPVHLLAQGDSVSAVRCDGVIAMTATVDYGA